MKKIIVLFTLLFIDCFVTKSFAIQTPVDFRLGEPTTKPEWNFTVPRSASRKTGVAPLIVHFSAGLTESSPTERSFHNYEYSWNFGDTSGVWGTTGTPKNIDKGPVAAHVYENAGTYIATLTVRNASGVVDTESFTITVTDPNSVYSGTKTTCITDTTNNNFTQCPAGANHVSTNNISNLSQYTGDGKRLLFHRGSSWNLNATPSISTGKNDSIIGAYGVCSIPNSQGICSNAPSITLSGTSTVFKNLDYERNLRLMDISFNGAKTVKNFIKGVIDYQYNLMLRVKSKGFYIPVELGHWRNVDTDIELNNSVVDCNLTAAGQYIIFIGSEKMALLGNVFQDADESHICRVWLAYQGVINHNILSGASLTSGAGRHAFKLQSPGEAQVGAAGSKGILHNSHFVVVADNIFGSSGPWTVSIAPENAESDQRISDLIFEKNKVIADYGTSNGKYVSTSVSLEGRYITARNNIINGANIGGHIGILVTKRGIEPSPIGIQIYNNTIYKSDASTYVHTGIMMDASSAYSIVKNNLVSYPSVTGSTVSVLNNGSNIIVENNIITDTPGLVGPSNVLPLSRDFSLSAFSPAINQGADVPVFSDFKDKERPFGSIDIGALER